MRQVLGFALLLSFFVITPANAQMPSDPKDRAQLEKTLDDVNNQWLCAGKYQKPKSQDCVNFRAQYWVKDFFEIYPNGQIMTKADMVTSQTQAATAHPDAAPGTGPNPQEFKLRAVYGDIALATDHTIFKAVGPNGQLTQTGESNVLRIFVKENGKWRPAAAALVNLEKPK
jgi:hypothetical protein